MVNVLLADRNGGYYFTPMKHGLNDLAEDRGVTLSLRTAVTADQTRQYIGWAEVIFIDGEMDSHIGANNSGYAITEEIKAQTPDSKVVLFSGVTKQYIPGCSKHDIFLPKPGSPESMFEIIRDYCKRKGD